MLRKMNVQSPPSRLLMGVLLGAALSLSACSSPPDQAMKDARSALDLAKARSECAPEKFSAAETLLKEAQALIKQEKYDEAELKAVAAKRLANQAKTEADSNWEDCMRRKAAMNKAKDPTPPNGTGPKTDPKASRKATLNVLYFAYDSAEISDAQRATLEENALWMTQNPSKQVTLEGHTDERGSGEYNLALGERRATQSRKYMMQLGASRDRMMTLSYGEEKPAAFGSSMDDYRKNRRVEFAPDK